MAKTAQATDKDANKGLNALLVHGVKDIYYAEKKIHQALPKMIDAAEDKGLKDALTSHRQETATQIERLEQIFTLMGMRPSTEKCDAIDGILKESEGLLENFGETAASDAAIIFSCQGVEHYEINRYGSMFEYARELELDDVAKLLKATLDEEHAADRKLTKIAEARINYAAMNS